MTTYQITIAADHEESDQFVTWLNEQGHDAEVGNDTGNHIDGVCTGHDETANEIMNDLWDAYCNA